MWDWYYNWTSFFPLMQKGGPIMIFILICSIIALAIICERIWVLLIVRKRIIPAELLIEVKHRVERGEIEDAKLACGKNASSLGRILIAGLDSAGAEREIIRERLEDRGGREAAELMRYLNVLSTVAGVAPLLGLLGTVTGMIKLFGVISLEGPGNPASMATGIAEALITTATGLTVAIPSYVAYRYFTSRAERLVGEMEEASLFLLDHIQSKPEGPEGLGARPSSEGDIS
jgi:biopolymer transport protein ExbB